MVKIHTDKNVADLLTKAFDFWSTAKVKTINEEGQIHAKVDGKKVIITEASIRRDLQSVDKGDRVGTWIIFLGIFLMYPRFIQLFLDKQLDGLSNHKRKYVAPSNTKKIFGNMIRVRKGLSRNITPLFPKMVVQSQMGEGSAIPTDPQHIPTILQSSSSQPQKTKNHKMHKRKNNQVPQPSGSTEYVADEVVHKEKGDRIRAATTASSLEPEQESGGGPRCQEAMGDTISQTRSKRVSKQSNDLLLVRGNTLQSGEDIMKLNELMEVCTTFQSRVLELEKTKTSQANEIDILKKRVKKLEKKQRSRTHKLKRLYKVNVTCEITAARFATTNSVVAKMTVDEVTLAQALMEIKSTKPKAKELVLQEPSESRATTTISSKK
nr:hypothetical protein [Tanacetum cinerariifolium]